MKRIAHRPRMRAKHALLGLAAAALTAMIGLAPAAADVVPYKVPVTLQASTSSPSVDAAAPYTPAVLSLIAQLESPPLTAAEIQNATSLLHDGTNNTCNAVGPVGGPAATDGAGNVLGTTLVGNATTLTSQTDATHIVVASAHRPHHRRRRRSTSARARLPSRSRSPPASGTTLTLERARPHRDARRRARR